MKNKKIIVILSVISLVLILSASTYAFFAWETGLNQKTNIVFTVESDFSCSADGGGNITDGDVTLMPTDCTIANNPYVIKRQINVNNTIDTSGKTIYMDLYLNVNSIGAGLVNSSNFKYVLTDSANGCNQGTVISSGNFYGKTAGSKVYIMDSKSYTENVDVLTNTYYLYIWLDKDEESNETMNQKFSLSLGGSCTDNGVYNESILNGAFPRLTEGMIPINYDLYDESTSTQQTKVMTVDPKSSDWYSYADSKWANMVLVKENGIHDRTYYQDNYGVEVEQDDIIAYFVWIPRYSYTIYGGTESTSNTFAGGTQNDPYAIDIKFIDRTIKEYSGEPKYKSVANGTGVTNWYTHPAFTFGDNELSGFWASKFEDGTITINSSDVLAFSPNKDTYIKSSIQVAFDTLLQIAGGVVTNNGNEEATINYNGNTLYGLTSSTNSHIMKDSEWTSMLYLSHSIYGNCISNTQCSEIYANNSPITGRSAGAARNNVNNIATQFPSSGDASTNKYNDYGYYTWDGREVGYDGTIGNYVNNRSLGYKASSTGNIYGVYDMSGGKDDITMGWRINAANSGTYSYVLPKSYYDTYYNGEASSHGDFGNSCLVYGKFSYCYGYALSETVEWYQSIKRTFYAYTARGGVYSASNYNSAAETPNTYTLTGKTWYIANDNSRYNAFRASLIKN